MLDKIEDDGTGDEKPMERRTVRKNPGNAYIELKSIVDNFQARYGSYQGNQVENFQLDQMVKDMQNLVNVLTLERSKDEDNFIAESKKRDEERLRIRAENERRRNEDQRR